MASKSATPTHPQTPPSSRSKDPNLTQRTDDTELLQILNILTLAYHRNKNQHRRSRWWKELGMLRRGLRRLLAGGEERMIGGGGITQRRVKGANNEGAEKNIAFLRERVLPRCWVAFSGVVADNQYAALGLMLMAALGRLGRLLGLDVKAAEAVEAVDASGEVVQEEEMGRGLIGAVQVEEDLGVLLLREEVMRTEEAQNNEIEKKYTRPKSEAVLVETEKLPAKKRRMKKQLDAIDELFSGLI